jgi:hypothetical protein
MAKALAPQVTRSYPGRLNDARKAMEKDAEKLAKDGYSLTAEAWEPLTDAKQSKHKSHGMLWKVTHPVGATLGVARFVGATAIAGLSPNDRGTLTATFERSISPEDR